MTAAGRSGSPAARVTIGSPAAVTAGLAVIYLVWGSTYVAIRLVVAHVPPLLGMGARFVTAGLLLATLIVVRRGRRGVARRLGTGREALAAAGVGVLLLSTGNGLVALAETVVPSGLAALLVAATPLWLVLLRTAGGDRVARNTMLGTLIGFAGIGLLVLPGSARAGGGGHVPPWGYITVVLAAASWALGSYVSGRTPLPQDVFIATTYEMLAAGVVLCLAGLARGEAADLHLGDLPASAWWAMVYLVLIGSLVAFSTYVWLLQHARLSLIATYAYVNPVVAVLLGALLLSERVTGWEVVGGAVVVLGVVLVVSTERVRRPVAQGPAVVDHLT